MVFSIAFLLSSYIYLILQTTINISVYKDVQEEIISMDSYIGDLDFRCMSLKKAINLDMAKTLGYAETSDVNFIDKAIVGKRLSLIGGSN